MKLIHPIYLDVPMLVSFAAALDGGLSLNTDVTKQTGQSSADSSKVAGGVGLSGLFSNFFRASLDSELAGERTENDQEVRRESKAHTEASIAILLYDRLRETGGYITDPENAAGLAVVGPGDLVEVAGTIEKNAIDQCIDYIDAVDILSSLDTSTPRPQKGGGKPKQSPLRQMREALDADRKRTPISNVALRCTKPAGGTVVVTLRTENLRDLTLSELHRNNVVVIGKVTRVIQEGEAMSAFENYGMSLLEPGELREAFTKLSSTPGVVAEFSSIEVNGPAVQVLPLMIFV